MQRTKTPVDIVSTVPVGWSYEAYNSIFRAVRQAGFNKTNLNTLQDTILVNEPEAASHFTAKDIQERDREFLKVDDCFILCDAGGGTVDVVSFQVKQVKPLLELEKATEPTGGQWGSSFIDTAFKNWLRDEIKADNYASIDRENARQQRISPFARENSAMRALMTRFNIKKAAFSKTDKSDIILDLPEPLNNLSLGTRVKEVELTLKCGIVKMILDQLEQVSTGKNRRVKNVLLVGGFGASPYLQEKLKESLAMRKIGLRLPDKDKSVTAVVQGGVVYGIEKSNHGDARYTGALMKSYGIVNNGQFEWLFKRGDLVISSTETIFESAAFYCTANPHEQGVPEFSIFSYPMDDSEDDDAPEQWLNGQHEVARVAQVTYDLSQHLDRATWSLRHSAARQPPAKREIGPFMWRFKLTARHLRAELLLKQTSIANREVSLEVDWPSNSPYFARSGENDLYD
ncbi:Chaperone protein DnaK [Pseudocercospora fuligena]|uniref:Chaperone protein DnaK n=1 Tax=Pseudocercospora fuligena TaxID=685502 RepID=A0A8H6R6X0_9PEZI|nr:Chaperone protein DnaK [Pseudocercospora fuligena]